MLLFNPLLEKKEEFHTFPKGISPKMDVVARLEFELAYNEVTVKHVNPLPQTQILIIVIFYRNSLRSTFLLQKRGTARIGNINVE